MKSFGRAVPVCRALAYRTRNFVIWNILTMCYVYQQRSRRTTFNRRLLHWCETNYCLTDAQFDFRPAHSTCDAIVALHSLISEYLNKKKKLYCCFVDYQKAFDSIDHAQLWGRLVKVGIAVKLLNVIKSMYQQIKSCVRFNNELSDFYTCFKGLVLGEALSPLIFSLFSMTLDWIYYMTAALYN